MDDSSHQKESRTACCMAVDMHSCHSTCQWKEKERREREGKLKRPAEGALLEFIITMMHWTNKQENWQHLILRTRYCDGNMLSL